MSETIGTQRPNDVRGWLVFERLPDDWQRAEDGTLQADHARIGDEMYLPATFTRPATDTEIVLLQHLGFDPPANLQTVVCWLSFGLRNRSWPALERS
ncbi:hypothetical protein ACGFK1_11730 [Mycobacterium sp. NPDC048908]|uniref:hypothetical protein n=1 Tax=Mycobacterium sp. NPDC048908 TaxID=3364292 RepID=UPI00371ACC4F